MDQTPNTDNAGVNPLDLGNPLAASPGSPLAAAASSLPVPSQQQTQPNPAPNLPPPGASATPVAPPKPPSLASKMAEGMMHAFSGSDGSPGGFIRATLAGGMAGLAAAAKTKLAPGAPILGGFGVGAEAANQQGLEATQRAQQQKQEATENAQRQQTLDLAKQREARESTTGDRDYNLRMREDARQQATSVAQASAFEKRGVLLDQDIAKGNFDSTKAQADYLRTQADDWDAMKAVGGKPLEVNGKTSPEFEHLGDAETYAQANFDAAAHPEFKTRLMRNPSTGQWTIMETPYEAPKWQTFTDASGKSQKVFADTQGLLAMQKQVAETQHYENTAKLSSLELKTQLQNMKDEGTVKGARKELTAVGGDYTQLTPGSREALSGDAQKRFTMAQTGLEKELSKPEELRDADTVTALTGMRNTYANEISNLTRPPWVAPPKTGANAEAAPADTKPAPVGPEGFAQEQKQKAADKAKAEADNQKNINERPAAPKIIANPMGGAIPNPAYNDAEAYIAAHSELTGEQRAQVRAKQEQTTAPKSGPVTVQIPGMPSGQIPADQLDAFKKAHPNAVVSQ
jgi:hypothetical protein